MVMKKIIFKNISKTQNKGRTAFAEVRKLKKAGYKNAYVTDFKTIGRGPKIKGVGTRVEAFKGRKQTPKGFKSKMEEF